MEKQKNIIFKPEEPETAADRYLHLVKTEVAKSAVKDFLACEAEINSKPSQKVVDQLRGQYASIKTLRMLGENVVADELEDRIGVSPNELD